jgi:hypothetical protein
VKLAADFVGSTAGAARREQIPLGLFRARNAEVVALNIVAMDCDPSQSRRAMNHEYPGEIHGNRQR